MKVLPNDTELGRLKFFEIYEDFLGPKCFSVKDELDHLYLVYWSGDYDNCTKWVYLPISQSTLDALLREELTFNKAFTDSKRLKVMSVYEGKPTVFESITKESINTVNLPPKDFELDVEDIQSIAPESQWDFNLHIAKKSDKHGKPTDSIVANILGVFGEITKSLMKGEAKTTPTIHPLSAQFGSFDVKLGASDHERAAVAIELLDSLLAESDKIEDKLAEIELDPYRLKNLLDIVHLNKLELTLRAKTSDSLKKPIIISSSKLLPVIEKLESMSLTIIDSYKVPQADSLERLICIVKHRVNGGNLTHEQIEGLNSQRQVRYYTHAAQNLGLFNKNLTVTSAGRFLAKKDDLTAQFQFLADRVESSDFGWAWMKWAQVSSISELDELTAEEFIRTCVKGLNRGTIQRRATSIKNWVKILKEHRRDYGDSLASED
ncbi:DUF6575 domain-containing protein [Agarivorans sp. Alg241-V36]|uniref:DUF6575 domain-containing protein n=1 Tax=Agarivorans sp. Alg241-V36 TaxID=2305992 RepID=UPI0013D1FE4C|nr:DUF6575 domain-containing protein [Agarivorans sp. Alg241-V36]